MALEMIRASHAEARYQTTQAFHQARGGHT
jgi:hypothetical protein